MNSVRLGEDYLRKATVRREALALLFRRNAHADVVREAQEIVELALKASLRLLGLEPPKVHDVGPYMKDVRHLLPRRWQRKLVVITSMSRKLAEDRSPAFYGDEEMIQPASALFGRGDAKRAMAAADLAIALLSDLLKPTSS